MNSFTICMLLVACCVASASASMSDEEYLALVKRMESEPGLDADQILDLLRQISDAKSKMANGHVPQAVPSSGVTDRRHSQPKSDYIEKMIEMSDYTSDKCNHDNILNLLAAGDGLEPNQQLYIRHHLLGLTKYCQRILVDSVENKLSNSGVKKQLDSLMEELQGADENNPFSVPTYNGIVRFLDPLARDKDLTSKKAFMNFYTSNVLDLCKQVAEMSELKTFRLMEEPELKDSVSRNVREWIKFYKVCKNIYDDVKLFVEDSPMFVFNQVHERLLEKRGLHMKRSLADKMLGRN